jgi:predicted DNA-binding transcriptional regulator AlpA
MSEEQKDQQPKEYLTIKDYHRLLGISRSQFWRLRKQGKIPNPAIENPPRWRRSQVETAG